MLKNLYDKLRVNPEEMITLKKEINTLNMKRIYLLSIIALPLCIIHIIVFGYDLSEATGEKYYWQLGIVINNIVTFIFLGSIALLARKFHKDSQTKNLDKAARTLTWFTFITVLCLGAVVAGIDQAVTPSITPFLVACTIVSVAILARPKYSIIGFLFGFTVFFLIMNQTQPNPDIRISNIVNGVTSICIGIGISIIMWFGNRERVQQQRTIAVQKHELEKSYNILVENSKKLEEANQVKDKFFSIVTHDIKSPLAGIIGALNLVKDSNDKAKLLFQDGILDLIHQSSERTERLLDNLVLWSRSQTNQLNFNPSFVSFGELLQENLHLLEASILNKKINIIKSLAERDHIYVDKDMVNAILRNLLSNAIKFTPKGGQISLLTSIVTHENKERLKVSIHDSGVGMTQNQITDLLQLQSSKTTEGTEKELGTGLGLMICKEFISKHQGELNIDSKIGTGSSFTFTLPMA